MTPEDYTSLWGWITFNWVYPLVQQVSFIDVRHFLADCLLQGRDTTLNEDDVWNMSPTMQSRPVFVKFSSLQYVLLAFPFSVLTCNKAGRHSFANFGRPTHWTSCMPFLIYPLRQLMKPSTSLDFMLTFVSVVFNYGGPFFLK